MFFGSVPQESPVVVKDSNPAAFECFLRFVYTVTTTITEAELFPLLYLGKKYTVESLIHVVKKHLEECITSENVGEIMLAGQNFLDDAPPKFWKSVASHGEALLKSDQFLQLRKDTVEALVQLELQVEEKLVYDKAVAWAKAECARNQRPTDGESLRSVLEGVLQHLRFPTMTAEEFAVGPAAQAVLSSEEKILVLQWFAAAIPQSIFPDTPRYTTESHVCMRLLNWSGLRISGSVEAVDFSVSRGVRITGLGAWGFYIDDSQMGRTYSITARLALGPVVLATKELTGTISQVADVIPVTFDKPVKTDTTRRYTASLVVTGPSTYCGCDGRSGKTVITKHGDVVFHFMDSEVSSYTSIHFGQIPQIFFLV